MLRQRKYETDAEKQVAYRERRQPNRAPTCSKVNDALLDTSDPNESVKNLTGPEPEYDPLTDWTR